MVLFLPAFMIELDPESGKPTSTAPSSVTGSRAACQRWGGTVHIYRHKRRELTFRISVYDKPINKRGLTIYGNNFGNYGQDLLARVLYDVQEE